MTVDEFIRFIFDSTSHPCVLRFMDWLGSSERFKAFSERYKDKIRDKVERANRDASERDESLRDVQFELEIAGLLRSVG